MGSCVSRPISKKHHQPQPSDIKIPRKLQDSIAPEVPHSGSTDETFFDTQPWLESDCDDDFYSIDGDYSPSRGDTPVQRRFSTGTPIVLTPSHENTGASRLVRVSSTPSRTSTPLHVTFAADKELVGHNLEISPRDKKKRLSELFRLSRGGNADENFLNDNLSADEKTLSGSVFTSVPGSPRISGATSVCSERTSNASIKSDKNKDLKSVHPICCLPKLLTPRHKNGKAMDVNSILD